MSGKRYIAVLAVLLSDGSSAVEEVGEGELACSSSLLESGYNIAGVGYIRS
jgi:hypothetical protein